jgi:hypothetical protein
VSDIRDASSQKGVRGSEGQLPVTKTDEIIYVLTSPVYECAFFLLPVLCVRASRLGSKAGPWSVPPALSSHPQRHNQFTRIFNIRLPPLGSASSLGSSEVPGPITPCIFPLSLLRFVERCWPDDMLGSRMSTFLCCSRQSITPTEAWNWRMTSAQPCPAKTFASGPFPTDDIIRFW